MPSSNTLSKSSTYSEGKVWTKSTNPGVDRVPAKNGFAFVKFTDGPYSLEKGVEQTWAWLSHRVANSRNANERTGGRLQIAHVDCQEYRGICDQFKITDNPTIMLFEDGSPIKQYKLEDYGYNIGGFQLFLKPYFDITKKRSVSSSVGPGKEYMANA